MTKKSDLDVFIDEMESHGYLAMYDSDGILWLKFMKELGVVFND